MTVRAPYPLDFRYLSDMSAPGLAYAAVLRSPHPHARIRSIDLAHAHTMPGVLCVATARDVPGRLRFGLRIADQPILCDAVVRTMGDPVAAVAAETRAAAEAARDAIRVEWEPLSVVGTAEDALAPSASRDSRRRQHRPRNELRAGRPRRRVRRFRSHRRARLPDASPGPRLHRERERVGCSGRGRRCHGLRGRALGRGRAPGARGDARARSRSGPSRRKSRGGLLWRQGSAPRAAHRRASRNDLRAADPAALLP